MYLIRQPILNVLIVWGSLLACFPTINGCSRPRSESNKSAVTITCAPEKIKNGQSAVLTILQITPLSSDKPVILNEMSIAEVTSVGRLTYTKGITPGGVYTYHLQVYQIKPLPDQRRVVISRTNFENLPSDARVMPMLIEVIP